MGAMRRISCAICAVALAMSSFPEHLMVTARKVPEASSTLLRMHRHYSLPPHDMSLYQVLDVKPNATVDEISKSYKRMSRQYHPDKNRGKRDPEAAAEKLSLVRQAYEVLKDDTRRLPYHKYGLIDPVLAMLLLMGPRKLPKEVGRRFLSNIENHTAQNDLLKLMGYDSQAIEMNLRNDINGNAERDAIWHRQRVNLLAARLVERLRPLVEGLIEEGHLVHFIATECDQLKTLPLGAQIIRCIGCAYRHAGQAYLRKHDKAMYGLKAFALPAQLSNRWRRAKNYADAAMATSRAAATEQIWSHQSKQRERKRQVKRNENPSIEYDQFGDPLMKIGQMDGDSDDSDSWMKIDEEGPEFDLDSEEEMKENELEKAQRTLLRSMQIEAMWKLSKIDLDQAISEACRMILSGHYFFQPSFQSADLDLYETSPQDGWISYDSGEPMHADIARLRAAAVMVLMGNVMVQCSKEGTTWLD